VSKIGCGMTPRAMHDDSMSWRAAWKTFSTASLVIRSKNASDQCPGQRVDHDRFLRAGHLDHAEQGIIGRLTQNSVSTVMIGCLARRPQTAASSAVVVIRSMHGP